MAQSRVTAKNTFGQGLIMDFAPDNTLATTLTNALNATLLTFNGNEMSLQNDMGNARVESAFLPEGYIPVGTCEFGDIIYIVSYNPIENRSLIGCFPSPERNISNKEISPITLTISPEEFISVYRLGDYKKYTGLIKSPSVKKIIFGSSNISPGDKFIISWEDSGKSNKDKISNYGNYYHNVKSVETYWPKLTKVHVVSIEDSGKLTYLDDTILWYDGIFDDGTKSDFVISSEKFQTENNEDNTANLDLYRHALQCQYSVFLSRVPGKLALLIELESINNFSCGHKIIRRTQVNSAGNPEEYYDIYFSASWETDNYNINPCGMLVTNSNYYSMTSFGDNDNLYISDNLNINEAYNPKRVIEFSRLYKLENPGNTYDAFLNLSYYSKIDSYNKLCILGEELEQRSKNPFAKNIIRVYNTLEDRAKLPKELNNMGIYVTDPIKLTIEEGNRKYYTVVNAEELRCEEIPIPDDVVVNYYKKSVLKKIASVARIDTLGKSAKESKTSHKIEYTVCPCMPYGPLSHLAISNVIDFDLNYTGEVELNTWKYYVNANSITLNYGFDTYLKEDENEVIEKIVIEFFDNLGICATYELKNQETYNTKFTEYIELDKIPSNFRFTGNRLKSGDSQNILDRELTEKIIHKGENTGQTFESIGALSDRTSYIYNAGSSDSPEWRFVPEKGEDAPNLEPKTLVYPSDAGIIYYGRPYIARIKIFKGIMDELGQIDSSGYEQPIIIDRWLWTAPVFNEEYTTTNDFSTCLFECVLDLIPQFDGREIKQKSYTYSDLNVEEEKDFSPYQSIGAQIDYVNPEDKFNIKFLGASTFSENFGNSIFLEGTADNLKNILVGLGITNKRIEYSSEFETIYSESFSSEQSSLYPISKVSTSEEFKEELSKYSEKLKELLGISLISVFNNYLDINTSDDSYKNYKDTFVLELKLKNPELSKSLEFYIDTRGNTHNEEIALGKITAYDLLTSTTNNLKLQGIKFNKMCAVGKTTKTVNKKLKPVIYNEDGLSYYGIGIPYNSYNKLLGKPYFKDIIMIGIGESAASDAYLNIGNIEVTNTVETTNDYGGTVHTIKSDLTYYLLKGGESNMNEWRPNLRNDKLTEYIGKDNLYQYPFRLILFNTARLDTYKHLDYQLLSIDAEPLTKLMGVTNVSGKKINTADKYHYVGAVNKDKTASPPFIKDIPESNIFATLGVVSKDNGELKMYNADSAILTVDKLGYLNQLYTWRDVNKDTSSIDSLALLLTSWLMQIYRVTHDSISIYLYHNIALLKDFKEYWKADIIVKQSINNLSYDTISDNSNSSHNCTSKYIKILPKDIIIDGTVYNGIPLNVYAVSVLLLAGYSKSNWDLMYLNNINPKIINTTKCVEFNYNLDYNVGNLSLEYNILDNSVAKLDLHCSDERLTSPKSISIFTPVDDNKLYVYTGGNSVLEYKSGAPIKLLEDVYYQLGSSQNVLATHKNKTIEINNNNLHLHLDISSGYLTIKDIETIDGASLEFSWENKVNKHSDYSAIRGLKKINIFNYGKL